jgi:hypothetical protein
MTFRPCLLLLAASACGGAPPTPPICPAAPACPANETATAVPDAGVAPDAAAAPAPARIPGGAITAEVLPVPAYIERTAAAQVINCDLRVANGTGVAWRLVQLEVTVLDGSGAPVWRKVVGDGGVSPAITMIPNRDLAAGETLLLLNPVAELARDLMLTRVRFALTYERIGDDERTVATAEVVPARYDNHAALRLPVAGRILVWDGHDLLSHHRRWDYVFAPIRAFGFDSNPGRYSYDLVPVDAAGAMSKGDPAGNQSWFGFGAPVVAPAAGKVVVVVADKPDDRQFDMGGLEADLMLIYGNHVVIDHGHGEHSLFAHLQQGSVRVKVGDTVAAGAPIAAIGASGSAMFPHLHYQLQDGPDAHAQGLPSYFHDVRRLRGGSARPATLKAAAIDSGDIVESAARPRR